MKWDDDGTKITDISVVTLAQKSVRWELGTGTGTGTIFREKKNP